MTLVELLDDVEIFKSQHFAVFVLIMYLSLLANAVMLMPLYGVLCICYAFVINDFFISAVLLAVLPVLVSVTMYLCVSNTTIPYLRTKLQRFSAFRRLDHNMDASAIAICLVIRFLYIPAGLKEYTILVLRYPFSSNLLSAILYFSMHACIFSGIGSQLHNANAMFKQKYWNTMSMHEKIDLALIFSSIAFTVSIFIYVTFWMRTRVVEDNNIDLSKPEIDDEIIGDSEEKDRLMD